MRRHENLRLARLQVVHQETLPVRLKAAFDLIDKRDGGFALVLLGNGKSRKPSRSRSPACQWQLHAFAFGGESDQRRDGQALPAGDRKIQSVRQALRLENQNRAL